jgi:phosphatidylinositol transfer protein SFH5
MADTTQTTASAVEKTSADAQPIDSTTSEKIVTEAEVPTSTSTETPTKTDTAPPPAVQSTTATSAEKASVDPSNPTWPALADDHPLRKFSTNLPKLLEEAEYNEVYGITLESPPTFHTYLILQKFLRANANDIEKAKQQLLATLKWRKTFKPLSTIEESYSASRFGGLGYIITLKSVPESTNKEDIATFNIYGSVKDPKKTFEDIDGFLRWRVSLMELSLSKLNLSTATTPIPDFGKGPDPYQAIQIHDYLQVSFLRQNPYTKAASKRAIDVFKDYYPETLSRKFFVNVPVVMGWMFTAVSLLLSKETVRKFTVLSYGSYLKDSLGEDVPEVYGGKGAGLEERGVGPKLNEE